MEYRGQPVFSWFGKSVVVFFGFKLLEYNFCKTLLRSGCYNVILIDDNFDSEKFNKLLFIAHSKRENVVFYHANFRETESILSVTSHIRNSFLIDVIVVGDEEKEIQYNFKNHSATPIFCVLFALDILDPFYGRFGGRIVKISSLVGFPRWPVLSCKKFGVSGFIKGFARAWYRNSHNVDFVSVFVTRTRTRKDILEIEMARQRRAADLAAQPGPVLLAHQIIRDSYTERRQFHVRCSCAQQFMVFLPPIPKDLDVIDWPNEENDVILVHSAAAKLIAKAVEFAINDETWVVHDNIFEKVPDEKKDN